MSTRNIEVTTSRGRRMTVVEHTTWIDASTKDDPFARMPGRKVIRLLNGADVITDGTIFTLGNGDTFMLPG